MVAISRFNWFQQVRRITIEFQAQAVTNPLTISNNVFGPSGFGTFNSYYISTPCCQFGTKSNSTGAANPAYLEQNNIEYANGPDSTCQGQTVGCNGFQWGVEYWGNNSQSNFNLIQGFACTGYEVGYNGANGGPNVQYNTLQGPIMAAQANCYTYGNGHGQYMEPEFGQYFSSTITPNNERRDAHLICKRGADHFSGFRGLQQPTYRDTDRPGVYCAVKLHSARQHLYLVHHGWLDTGSRKRHGANLHHTPGDYTAGYDQGGGYVGGGESTYELSERLWVHPLGGADGNLHWHRWDHALERRAFDRRDDYLTERGTDRAGDGYVHLLKWFYDQLQHDRRLWQRGEHVDFELYRAHDQQQRIGDCGECRFGQPERDGRRPDVAGLFHYIGRSYDLADLDIVGNQRRYFDAGGGRGEPAVGDVYVFR